MGGKKSAGRMYPAHLKGGKLGAGIQECSASGFLRRVGQTMEDVRQGLAAKEFADVTPGFGTYHPQDVKALGNLVDPKAVSDAHPKDDNNFTKAELGYSDAEIKLSIQEGRAPRRGY